MLSFLLKRLLGLWVKFRVLITLPINGSYVSLNNKFIVDYGGKVIIHNNSRIYENSKVLVLREGCFELGSNSVIERGSEISVLGCLSIGHNTGIGSYSNIRCTESINIGNNVLIAQFVSILDGQYDYKGKSHLIKHSRFVNGSISIGDDVWVGVGATICKGVHLGKGSVIGAGAVVTKDVEQYSVVAGVPARKISSRE